MGTILGLAHVTGGSPQRRSGRFLRPLSFAAACFSFFPAQAADAADETSALDEIIVTALKRESPAQQTPITITAFDADDIKAGNLSSLVELGQFVPNANFSQSALEMGSPLAAAFFIRGIGQLDFMPTMDAGVGLYVDNVYIARAPGAVLDLADIQQVEVLKGPQGALFGKNTIGGVVNVTTQSPDVEAFKSAAGITVGERQRLNADAELNIPISSEIAARMSVGYRSKDGFVDRPYGNGPTGADDSILARGKLAIRATDRTNLLIAADYRHTSAAAPMATIPVFDENTALVQLFNALVGGPSGAPLTATNTVSPDDRTDLSDGYDHTDFHGGGVSMQIEQNFAAGLLRSVTAYRSLYSRNRRDSDGSIAAFNYDDYLDRSHQWSEELNFLGRSFDDRLRWTVGASYFREIGDSRNYWVIAPGLYSALEALSAAVIPLGAFSCPGGPACAGGAGNPLNVQFDLDLTGKLHTRSKSVATFADMEWAFTPRLAVVAGLRYTADTKGAAIAIARNVSGAYYVPPSAPPDRTWDKLSPRAGVNWQLGAQSLLYTSVAHGFKSGGFNPRPGNQAAASTSFDPEQLWAYEFGSKNEWWQRRLRLNAAVFYYDYRDMQLLAAEILPGEVATTEVITNVGRSRLYGADLDATMAVTNRFSVQAALGHLQAHYLDSAFAITGIQKNTPLQKAAKWTGSATAQYVMPLRSGSLLFRADYAYTSANYPDARATPELQQRAHGLVNARASWSSAGEHWTAALYGKNVFDTRYIQNGFDSRDLQGSVIAVPNEPRELGVQLGTRF